MSSLAESKQTISRKLCATAAKEDPKGEALRPELTAEQFQFEHNEDAMAVEKLAEGIRLFNRDARKVEDVLKTKLK